MQSATRAKVKFHVELMVALPIENVDVVHAVFTPVDPHCPGDWISASFLKDMWGIDYSDKPRKCIAATVHNVEVFSLGDPIDARWRRSDKFGWWTRYYDVKLQVVDAPNLTVIMGQPSIDRYSHNLRKRCLPFIGYHDRPSIKQGGLRLLSSVRSCLD